MGEGEGEGEGDYSKRQTDDLPSSCLARSLCLSVSPPPPPPPTPPPPPPPPPPLFRQTQGEHSELCCVATVTLSGKDARWQNKWLQAFSLQHSSG